MTFQYSFKLYEFPYFGREDVVRTATPLKLFFLGFGPKVLDGDVIRVPVDEGDHYSFRYGSVMLLPQKPVLGHVYIGIGYLHPPVFTLLVFVSDWSFVVCGMAFLEGVCPHAFLLPGG